MGTHGLTADADAPIAGRQCPTPEPTPFGDLDAGQETVERGQQTVPVLTPIIGRNATRHLSSPRNAGGDSAARIESRSAYHRSDVRPSSDAALSRRSIQSSASASNRSNTSISPRWM